MAGLQKEALEQRQRDCQGQGVYGGGRLGGLHRPSAPNDTLVELDHAPGKLVVRCTVHVEGPGAGKLHAEGPMNG